MPGWLWIVLSVPRTCDFLKLLTDRIQVCRGARIISKNSVYKPKNALCVFS